MDETGFLKVADNLSTADTEADWRTAVSRAYYAAFHKARRLLRQNGFAVPPAARAHAYLWMRLNNAQHPDVANAGLELNQLRKIRNWADYDFDVSMNQKKAFDAVQIVADILRMLDDLAAEPAILTRVVDAIKVYERDVLRDVTWHS